jgi:hypothetical protein
MRRFTGRAVAVQELHDLNAFVVVLAENPDGSGARLELQKALSFDEQDRTLGLDTYCLCTEAGATCYGGVIAWTLGPNALEIRLEADAAETLGAPGFAIDFPSEDFAALRGGLTRVLGLPVAHGG